MGWVPELCINEAISFYDYVYRLALRVKFSDDILKHLFLFVFFPSETGFDISRKLSPICMKCQILFPRKNKKENISLSSVISFIRELFWGRF